MSDRQMRLKYIVSLISDIPAKAKGDAEALTQAQAKVQAALEKTDRSFDRLGNTLLTIGRKTGDSADQQARYIAKIGMAALQAQERVERLKASLAKGLDKLPGTVAGITAGAVAGERTMAIPIKAFASLEEATTQLKVALMSKGGGVDANFGAIQRKAVELGNKLPGTTKDFITSAVALSGAGVPSSAIANGALESAAYMGVLLKMPQEQAALTVAKMREAYALREDEIPAMADIAQRNRFAFGLHPSDLLEGAKYSASTLNGLGLTGKGNLSEILTLQGLAAQKGLDGSTWGTSFNDLLVRMATGPKMLEEAKKGMKGKAKEALLQSGLDFNFFGADGQLKELDGSRIKAMMKELEKLETIRAKMGPQAEIEIAQALFGMEGARPAELLAGYGVKGFEAARGKVENQADLQERVTETLTTLNAKMEALSGTVENLGATMATQLGHGLKGPTDSANDMLGGGISDWFTAHPAAGTAGVLGAGATSAGAAWLLVRKMFGLGGGGSSTLGNAASSIARGIGAAGAVGSELAPGVGSMVGKAAGAAKRMPLLALMYELFGTSDADMAVLNHADYMRDAGSAHRGAGFTDPRRLDLLGLTAPPGSAGGSGPAGMPLINLGQGELAVKVTVDDQRASAVASVTAPLNGVRINAGNTNPAGYAGATP